MEIPCSSNWTALEQCATDGDQRHRRDEKGQPYQSVTHPFCREQSPVCRNDGELDQGKGSSVETLAEKQELYTVFDAIEDREEVKIPQIASKAVAHT